MMLLIGMWISLTKNPMKPMIQKPMAVAMAIFWNSRRSGFVHRLINRIESLAKTRPGSQNFTTWSIVQFNCNQIFMFNQFRFRFFYQFSLPTRTFANATLYTNTSVQPNKSLQRKVKLMKDWLHVERISDLRHRKYVDVFGFGVIRWKHSKNVFEIHLFITTRNYLWMEIL